MTSSLWTWNQQIAPAIPEYFPFAAWKTLEGQRLTPGGVAARLISLSVEPLLLFVSPGRVLASVSSVPLRDAVHTSLAASAASVAVFIPGERVGNRYPVSSPGSVVQVSSDFPLSDVRSVLVPPLPTFTASSLINDLSCFGSESPSASDWLVTLDQISGEVRYFKDPGASPVHVVPPSGGEIIIAFESL